MQILEASIRMDVLRSGVEGVARFVSVQAQGPEQGEAHRRQLPVDRAAFEAHQSEADCAGRGADQCIPTAGIRGRIFSGFADVRRLPPHRGQRLLEVQGILLSPLIKSTIYTKCVL